MEIKAFMAKMTGMKIITQNGGVISNVNVMVIPPIITFGIVAITTVIVIIFLDDTGSMTTMKIITSGP